jgi:hypothetical protein
MAQLPHHHHQSEHTNIILLAERKKHKKEILSLGLLAVRMGFEMD